jgi:putative ABC transport system permease protein
VNRLLLLSALRHLRRHPWQTWLSIIGIALGVTVIVAVDLANQSARQAFLLSAETLTGRVTHQILGGQRGIPESFYRELRIERGLRQSAPVVEGLVKLGAESLQLIGIDPLAEAPFRQVGVGLGTRALRELFTQPATVLLSSITAKRLELMPGDTIDVTVAGRPVTLRIAGWLEGDNPAVTHRLARPHRSDPAAGTGGTIGRSVAARAAPGGSGIPHPDYV